MDIKATAVKPLQDACRLFLNDLQALPEDSFSKSFGPKVRTVADIVYEVNLVNDHIGMVIRGEEPFDWPDVQWIKAPEGFAGKEVVIDAFEASARQIVDTVEAFSAEDLAAPLQTEEGQTTRHERCRFMVVHLWYHSGQLNFIQTLLGDDAWHWK